ncbi:MAG TPA: NAD(P)-dependent oxidoreductase [Thermosynechococcaceae cyanobacterium]
MTLKRIFVTGASGCVGHYVVESLIQETTHELYLLVRNPEKLNVSLTARSGITVLQGDLREIEKFAELLKTIDTAVLIATAWGGADTFEINTRKMTQLIDLLDPEVCQQVIYFSTASILDRDNNLLKEAGEIGTDYIRSKYACFQALPSLSLYSRITTLFPTLLLGGDAHIPQSHVSSGVARLPDWSNALRFFSVDGCFHFIHSKDIAQIVRYLIDRPPAPGESRKLVLGNDRVEVDEAIEEICAYFRKRIYFRIPLTPKLTDFVLTRFRIKMEEWDRFSVRYRYFTHRTVVSPATLGLPTYCATFGDVLKLSSARPHS